MQYKFKSLNLKTPCVVCMKVHLYRLVILVSSLAILYGCGESGETRRIMHDFMNSEIVLPKEFIVVSNGEVSMAKIENNYPRLVSFYGYKDCYDCEIAHLSSKRALFSLDDEWTNTCNIPADLRFHTFLLDSTDHPIFVGDPTRSPELMNLFTKRLYNSNNRL